MIINKMKKKTKKGFTLIELIVVLSISALVMVGMGGGVITLQANVRLDNAIRDLKSEIQTVASSARNSFIAGGSGSVFETNSDSYLSLGWIIEFENTNSSSAKIIRRSVFFKPDPSYPITLLKSDIDSFNKFLTDGIKLSTKKTFKCDSFGRFYQGDMEVTRTNANGFNSVSNTRLDVKCGRSNQSGEYFETTIANVQFVVNFPIEDNSALNSCWESNGQKSIFFSTGYSQPVLNYNLNRITDDCQLQIQNVSFANSSIRALKVSKVNGVVEICGVYCVR